MSRIKKFIKEEIKGWKHWEIIWLAIQWIVILGLSIYWKDSVMGIISALAGITCVVCTGKGKRSAYIFGAVNALLYAIIAWNAKYYGEVMLNGIYYFPMQFYGFYVWNKNMNRETFEVEKKRMTGKGRMILAVIIVVVTFLYGLLLKYLGGELPFVDSLSTSISVITLVIQIKMYMEQWILWIIVDAVTIVMWAIAFAGGNDSIATLLMWIVYLANGVIMYVKWAKELKKK